LEAQLDETKRGKGAVALGRKQILRSFIEKKRDEDPKKVAKARTRSS